MTIREFSGEFRFLSNFFPSPMRIDGLEWPTVEHRFQAVKTVDAQWRGRIAEARTAATAKRLGQEAPLRPRWDVEKFGIMHEAVRQKFLQNPDLGGRLAATGTVLLVEGNTWHDQTWGDCSCPEHREVAGRNALGIILMRLRLDWQADGSAG